MLQSNPSKTVEKLVRLHCRKLPHKVSKAFKAGMRMTFWFQVCSNRVYVMCPDYKPGSAKFDAFKAGAAYARGTVR